MSAVVRHLHLRDSFSESRLYPALTTSAPIFRLWLPLRDIVTEGVITISKVLDYAKDYLGENKLYDDWTILQDGASCIARMLFEDATDINFYVGRAVNAAHQNPNLPITFNIKMQLVDELSKCLRQMGKKIKVSYF